MRVEYDKEGIDPCKCQALYFTAAHDCQCVPVTSFRTGINDNESDLHHDYEVWLEELAPHAPIDQAGPEAGCTTALTKPANGKPLSREERANNADAHLKRHGPPSAAVVAVTNGRLGFGTWERIFYGEFKRRRRKRVLVKIIGE
jgi:thiamine phosphate synthase YjbQ (UPF0047 family)